MKTTHVLSLVLAAMLSMAASAQAQDLASVQQACAVGGSEDACAAAIALLPPELAVQGIEIAVSNGISRSAIASDVARLRNIAETRRPAPRRPASAG